MIELSNVKVSVGDRSAGAFTVHVDKMEVKGKAVLLGPNGSGKTTLLRTMAGLIPYEGSIRMNSVEVNEAKELLEVSSNLPEIYNIGYLVDGLIEILEDFKGIDRNEFMGIMRRLNINVREILRKPVFALSAGQSAMVRLALALSSRPRVILIDEPFENVDSARRSVVISMLLEYGEEGIIVTHELDVLGAFKALNAYLMLEGRLYGPVKVGDLLESGIVEGEAQGALLTVSISGKTYSIVKGGGVKFGELGSLNRLYGLLG
ncbi:MAG: ATP-binding cassette domain-containing protein [Caldivirga sp.]|jgi:ABC-2 type transport system ATP-binding protein